VAIIWRSRDTVGLARWAPASRCRPDVVDKRLKDFRVFYHGERPKTMLPHSREYYVRVMIEVGEMIRSQALTGFPGRTSIRQSGCVCRMQASCSSRLIEYLRNGQRLSASHVLRGTPKRRPDRLRTCNTWFGSQT